LRGRGTDADDVIERRLRDAASDMTHWSDFDFVVVNDDFDRALADLHAIVRGHGDSVRRERHGLKALAETLTNRGAPAENG
jgi:guanylate kinase